ncbi:ClpP/crotonase [Auriculariales sp. MPI-PUGE-AT-0066]|nr:ClpP/crotonase [Auriculariales sp. MPI-PUGE-AT-0066]
MSTPSHGAQGGVLLVSRPAEHVLLLTMNRPDVLNAMNDELEFALAKALDDFDATNDLWVCIVAGNGRIFCAGADLTQWQNRVSSSSSASQNAALLASPHGFGALSRRTKSTKPIIAAVHGGAYGGGCEIVLNCDLCVAEENAKFALPEALRGVVAAQGGMVRLASIAGHQLASDMLLTGRTVSAREAYERFRFVTTLAPKGKAVEAAVDVARKICEASPDSVRSTKRALIMAKSDPGAESSFTAHTHSAEARAVYDGANIREGLAAFKESKRKPVWNNAARL